MEKQALYYDDIEVGTEFPPLVTQISREDTQIYAEAVEDYNPIFINEGFAKKNSKYGDLVNHPTTAALLSTNAYRASIEIPVGIIHAKQYYKFFFPTRPGEELIATAKIIDKYIKRGKKYVIIKTVTKNRDNAKKFESIATLIWPE